MGSMKRTIAVIDLKSFYASVECACRHLDPFTTPLVCCDPYRSGSSVVMSVTPFLKERYHVPNVCRKRDLPKLPDMIYAIPRMSYYLRVSSRVLAIFLEHFAMEDIHVYSVDESFIDLTPYLKMYGKSAEDICRDLQVEIKKRCGITATVGISENMFLAKCALDLEGKKKPPFMATWTVEDGRRKLGKVYPLDKIWGIAGGMSRRLHSRGIRTYKDLQQCPTEMLETEFGIMGDQLYDLSNGSDETVISEDYEPENPSLTLGQTLNREYTGEEIELLIREMASELAVRLRASHQLAGKVSLMLGYSDGHGMFSRQRSLPIPTDNSTVLMAALLTLSRLAEGSLPIRSLSISYGKLSNPEFEQLSLFTDAYEEDERRSLDEATDAIRQMYGKDAILKASALLDASTIKMRHGNIGGHKQ